MATVSAKVFEHHLKADGTFNVKICIYHKKDRKYMNFVANKLALKNLILLNGKKTLRLNDLDKETYQFFQKIPDYDTLRLILCKRAILVEGDI